MPEITLPANTPVLVATVSNTVRFEIVNTTPSPTSGCDVHVSASGGVSPANDLAVVAPGGSRGVTVSGPLYAWSARATRIEVRGTPVADGSITGAATSLSGGGGGVSSLSRVTSATDARYSSLPFDAATAASPWSLVFSSTFDGALSGWTGATTKWAATNGKLVGTFLAADSAAWIANALNRPAAESILDGRVEMDLPAGGGVTGQWIFNFTFRVQAGGDFYFMSGGVDSVLTPSCTVYKVVGGVTTQVGKFAYNGVSPAALASGLFRFVGSWTSLGGKTKIQFGLWDINAGAYVGDIADVVDASASLQGAGTWGVTALGSNSSPTNAGTLSIDALRVYEFLPTRPITVVGIGDSNEYGAKTTTPGGATAPPAQLAAALVPFFPGRTITAVNKGVSGSHTGSGSLGYAPGASSGNLTAAIAAIPTYGDVLVELAIGTNDAGSLYRLTPVQYGTNLKAMVDAIRAARPLAKIVIHAPVTPSAQADYGSGGAYWDAQTLGTIAQYPAQIAALVATYPSGVYAGDLDATAASPYRHADMFATETIPNPSAHFVVGGTFQLHLNDAGAAWIAGRRVASSMTALARPA